MLSLVFITVLTLGIFTRPTQAELLNTVTQTAGCMLNIIGCTTPPSDPPKTPDQTPVNTTPPSDTTKPTATVTATPNPAGGASNIVTINGTVKDDTNLANYTISVNGTVAQQASISGTSADVSFAWNLTSPDVVPSGTYTITLDVTDAAGNAGDQAVTTVDVDNDAPTVTIANGGIIKSGSISPEVTIDDAHPTYTYAWTASSDNPDTLTYDQLAMQPTFTPTVEGTYVFFLQVTDGLGNVSFSNEYDFGYQQDLAPVPLPTTTSPTDGLTDTTPSTPTIAQASISPVINAGRDEMTPTDQPSVLGSSVTATDQATPIKAIATIAPTSAGWSIFGILWYWWLVIIGILLVSWYFIKKLVASRLVQQS